MSIRVGDIDKRSRLLLRYAPATIALLLVLSLIPNWQVPGAVTFNPPGGKAPKQSTGGASRGGGRYNLTTSVSVTSLLPPTNYGLTLAERPTFFVYVPQTSAKEVFFSLQDESKNHHYQTTFLLPDKPGVIGFRLPNEAPAIRIDNAYKWSLVLICDRELEPDSPAIVGWIRRVELNSGLKHDQKRASLELASSLASAGIWYDALSTLALIRRSQPENPILTTSWEELLKSVGLNAIATEPLINY